MICWKFFWGDNTLAAAPIYLLHAKCGQIHALQTAHIDYRHFLAAFRVATDWPAATHRAEMMFDLFFAELVCGQIAFRRAEAYLVARYEPPQRTAFTAY